MLIWEYGSIPTGTQAYNIENQVLGEGQIEGKREVFVYLWGEMVYTIYTIDVNRQAIFYIARIAFLP